MALFLFPQQEFLVGNAHFVVSVSSAPPLIASSLGHLLVQRAVTMAEFEGFLPWALHHVGMHDCPQNLPWLWRRRLCASCYLLLWGWASTGRKIERMQWQQWVLTPLGRTQKCFHEVMWCCDITDLGSRQSVTALLMQNMGSVKSPVSLPKILLVISDPCW